MLAKILFYLLPNLLDLSLTLYALDHGGREVNPVLGRDKKAVILRKVIVIPLEFILDDKLQGKHRKICRISVAVLNGGLAINTAIQIGKE